MMGNSVIRAIPNYRRNFICENVSVHIQYACLVALVAVTQCIRLV